MEKQKEVHQALLDFLDQDLERLILSNPRNKEHFLKLTVRPVLLQGELKFQIEEFTQKQAFQKNLTRQQAVSYLLKQLEILYRNGEAVSEKGVMNILIGKKGTVTLKLKKSGSLPSSALPQKDAALIRTPQLLSHNRKKRHILEEGVLVPFLEKLGVMTQDGTVVKAKYDKFRQINRFLEFIEDVLPQLDQARETVIVDFGCGKSYLTFAMYYYLSEMKGYPVRIVGLDLKKDVIALCSRLSEAFGFHKLHFYEGDIAGFEGLSQVDMVVSLHACDTATDLALEKAIRWKAKVILAVPCCQHELNRQIESSLLSPVLKYGILKERMSALITDGIRAELLEAFGYRTQILEFIDMEHTPKNLLIRGIRQRETTEKGAETERKAGAVMEPLEELIGQLHVSPCLYRLLAKK